MRQAFSTQPHAPAWRHYEFPCASIPQKLMAIEVFIVKKTPLLEASPQHNSRISLGLKRNYVSTLSCKVASTPINT
jgi:hypothetical protein